jgi:aspartate aminotransferase
MSIVAKSLSRINASPSQMITALAMDLQRQGRDVLTLSAGEPDFDTPEHIKRAAMDALTRGETKYSAVPGIPQLREAVCEKLQRENGLTYTAQQTIICPGGKQVLYNALMASLDPGDEVIIPAPYWVSYPDMVLLANGKPVIIDTDRDNGFKLSPQTLEAAITPRTKWLMLNNPGNPSGAVLQAKDLQALADVLHEHPHVWVITDDIYEHIRYDDMSFATIAQVAPELIDRTLVVNGFSKGYCMTGWRIGYGAGPKELIDAMIKMQSQSSSCVCSFIQWAAISALQGEQSFIAEHNAIFQQRRDLALSILNQSNGLSCQTPGGSFYLYVDCSGVIGKNTPQGKLISNDEDFATYLLDSEGVAAVHGAAFGMSPYFRISYALATDKLEDACNRIQRACGELSVAKL